MNDIDHAHDLLKLARMVLKTLTGMPDRETFAEAVFGFHAQQAIEKGLKAWLARMGTSYPKTHDLRLLLVLLEEKNQAVDDLWDLLEFTPYAVHFRYDWITEETPLDREEIIHRITTILNLVNSQIRERDPDNA